MKDQFWQLLRYALILLGGYLAGKGIIPADQVITLVDQIMNALPGLISIGAAAWGLYVKFRTRAVPITTAERKDVPTVSAATGAVEKPGDKPKS